MAQNIYDLIVIGAGPAGIACGIEAQKSDLKYTILEKGVLVNSIYNFPTNMTFFSTSKNLEVGQVPFISHSDKPTRREALEYYRRLVSSYALNIEYRTIVLNIRREEHFLLETNQGAFQSKNVIVATGYYDTPRLLHVPGEDLEKVHHYYDDAHTYIGQKIIVVGGANSACDVALETWQKGADVTMVVRQSALYKKVKYWILPNIENRISEGSIKAFFNSTIKSIHKEEVIIDTQQGEMSLPNDYVLAMTGYAPDYNFLSKIGLEFSDNLERIPIHNRDTLESNIENLYLAGVINSGMLTSKLFIENTREHGRIIIEAILSKQ